MSGITIAYIFCNKIYWYHVNLIINSWNVNNMPMSVKTTCTTINNKYLNPIKV